MKACSCNGPPVRPLLFLNGTISRCFQRRCNMPHVTSNPEENQIVKSRPIPAEIQTPVPDPERHYWPLSADVFLLLFLSGTIGRG